MFLMFVYFVVFRKLKSVSVKHRVRVGKNRYVWENDNFSAVVCLEKKMKYKKLFLTLRDVKDKIEKVIHI